MTGKWLAAVLAPLAVELATPMAVDASEAWGAAIRRYGTQEQVSSATEFSDLRATDWAYQALSNLLERYGCVAGYPNGMFAGSH